MRDRNIWIFGPCEHDHPHVFDLECVLELDEDISSFCLYVHTFSDCSLVFIHENTVFCNVTSLYVPGPDLLVPLCPHLGVLTSHLCFMCSRRCQPPNTSWRLLPRTWRGVRWASQELPRRPSPSPTKTTTRPSLHTRW